jgi:cytoskeletal protein RodZ
MTIWRRLRPARGHRDADAEVAPVAGGPGIGAQLRERRRQHGLSLADVERDTRINALYLEALEAEDFAALPAPVYARGFMRSYARYLGLDPDAAAAAVPRDLPRPLDLEPFPGLRRAGGAPAALPAVSPTAIAIGAAAVLLVVAALFLASRLRGRGVPAPVPTVAASVAPGGAPLAPTLAPAGAAGTAQPTGTAAASGTTAAIPPFQAGTLPNFTGVPRDDAVAFAQQLQLKPTVVEEASATVAAGRVMDQSPVPGTPVKQNDSVTLFVSKGSGN